MIINAGLSTLRPKASIQRPEGKPLSHPVGFAGETDIQKIIQEKTAAVKRSQMVEDLVKIKPEDLFYTRDQDYIIGWGYVDDPQTIPKDKKALCDTVNTFCQSVEDIIKDMGKPPYPKFGLNPTYSDSLELFGTESEQIIKIYSDFPSQLTLENIEKTYQELSPRGTKALTDGDKAGLCTMVGFQCLFKGLPDTSDVKDYFLMDEWKNAGKDLLKQAIWIDTLILKKKL